MNFAIETTISEWDVLPNHARNWGDPLWKEFHPSFCTFQFHSRKPKWSCKVEWKWSTKSALLNRPLVLNFCLDGYEDCSDGQMKLCVVNIFRICIILAFFKNLLTDPVTILTTAVSVVICQHCHCHYYMLPSLWLAAPLASLPHSVVAVVTMVVVLTLTGNGSSGESGNSASRQVHVAIVAVIDNALCVVAAMDRGKFFLEPSLFFSHLITTKKWLCCEHLSEF